MMPESPKKDTQKWHHPLEVMKLHKLKMKKKALQARIKGNANSPSILTEKNNAFDDVLCGRKRKNPFLSNKNCKKTSNDCSDTTIALEESTDQTLFKLIHQPASSPDTNPPITSFKNVLNRLTEPEIEEPVEIVKARGKDWLPIDWTLKSKIRFLSEKPFAWNSKLKVSEEASGITAFTRCLDTNSETTLDTSPNAKFYQCCLYWQQPSLPGLDLFPRNVSKVSSGIINYAANRAIKESLQQAWADSLRSLFQLIRTKQCPYFYACANTFTVLFRAAGIGGYSDVHAFITPTTRGFRQLLKQEDIEFVMPLKKGRTSDQGYETLDSILSNDEQIDEPTERNDDEDVPDEKWLQSMGLDQKDIKQINYTQDKLNHRSECEVDNSEQSLILVEGIEVHALFNFLINCKSATAVTGTFAGIPPTLLAPVAFQGATLKSLKVRENKVHLDDSDYYSLEICGPILPCTIHNIFNLNSIKNCMTATFSNLKATEPFSKVFGYTGRKSDLERKGTVVFNEENLRDCGLSDNVLKHFCSADPEIISNVDCLKFSSEDNTYTWT